MQKATRSVTQVNVRGGGSIAITRKRLRRKLPARVQRDVAHGPETRHNQKQQALAPLANLRTRLENVVGHVNAVCGAGRIPRRLDAWRNALAADNGRTREEPLVSSAFSREVVNEFERAFPQLQ
jgi:hypothetical protein